MGKGDGWVSLVHDGWSARFSFVFYQIERAGVSNSSSIWRQRSVATHSIKQTLQGNTLTDVMYALPHVCRAFSSVSLVSLAPDSFILNSPADADDVLHTGWSKLVRKSLRVNKPGEERNDQTGRKLKKRRLQQETSTTRFLHGTCVEWVSKSRDEVPLGRCLPLRESVCWLLLLHILENASWLAI